MLKFPVIKLFAGSYTGLAKQCHMHGITQVWQCCMPYHEVGLKKVKEITQDSVNLCHICESCDLFHFSSSKRFASRCWFAWYSHGPSFFQPTPCSLWFSKQVVMRMRQTTWTETSSLIPHLRRPSACAHLLNTTSSAPWSPTLLLTTTQMPRTSSSLLRKQA